jgi:hypothetical protein
MDASQSEIHAVALRVAKQAGGGSSSGAVDEEYLFSVGDQRGRKWVLHRGVADQIWAHPHTVSPSRANERPSPDPAGSPTRCWDLFPTRPPVKQSGVSSRDRISGTYKEGAPAVRGSPLHRFVSMCWSRLSVDGQRAVMCVVQLCGVLACLDLPLSGLPTVLWSTARLKAPRTPLPLLQLPDRSRQGRSGR